MKRSRHARVPFCAHQDESNINRTKVTLPFTVHINDAQIHLRCRQGLRHDLLHVELLLQSRQRLLLLLQLRSGGGSRPRRRRHRPSRRRRLGGRQPMLTQVLMRAAAAHFPACGGAASFGSFTSAVACASAY